MIAEAQSLRVLLPTASSFAVWPRRALRSCIWQGCRPTPYKQLVHSSILLCNPFNSPPPQHRQLTLLLLPAAVALAYSCEVHVGGWYAVVRSWQDAFLLLLLLWLTAARCMCAGGMQLPSLGRLPLCCFLQLLVLLLGAPHAAL